MCYDSRACLPPTLRRVRRRHGPALQTVPDLVAPSSCLGTAQADGGAALLGLADQCGFEVAFAQARAFRELPRQGHGCAPAGAGPAAAQDPGEQDGLVPPPAPHSYGYHTAWGGAAAALQARCGDGTAAAPEGQQAAAPYDEHAAMREDISYIEVSPIVCNLLLDSLLIRESLVHEWYCDLTSDQTLG